MCAEIGVWKGGFSRLILAQSDPRELHLIDPWLFQGQFPNRLYGGKIAQAQGDMDKIYEDVKRRFRSNEQVVIHRSTSVEALRAMKDDYFDWIYIDGDHSYEAVLKDLDIGECKVRKGGFLTGDDFYWRPNEGFPVKRAVDEFVAKRKPNLRLELIGSQFRIQI
ncbi:MAG TPA: class I SAM-dependent methyltransferase [Verrucomicrobiae bacterium]|nr:class I SAM-dependent methyltransferase [Verrucomicrobiae bacterium]